ncbi:hypothetical protein ER308_15600 [Egibacter rhizosphaerae]|uniref:DUF1640 domain-containing protein n=1 Tax=Egibacter rhizosphaerae TaxID=1670831 RepID=A0A411YHW0_9ACTN|nr:hypothetical protein [Egibacter rhizosphaerae]QBI20854.1 hypothetical protein ER308_15600 [Egibacter rhizosphaerae]
MPEADAKRLRLLRKLESVLGAEEAETLMTYLPPVDWSQLATNDHVDQRIDALRSDLRAELADTRAELRAEITDTRSQIRLEIARWGRLHVYTTLGAVVATGALAFAAAGLS